MTTLNAKPITAEVLTEWANVLRERTMNELRELIKNLQGDLTRLESGEFCGNEHPLRYRQYCEELHGMKTVAKMIDYAPSEVK